MIEPLRRRLDALDDHRLRLVERVDALGAGAWARPAAPGAWSAAQLADHLLRIDAFLRLDGRPGAAGATSGLRRRALGAVLGLPLRIPAPPGAEAVMPAAAPHYPDVRDRWAALRADWRRTMDDFSEADLRRMAYRHPLLGPFALPDALDFLLDHHRHHDPQLERIAAAVA
jgi:hypothetical protein